MPYSNVAGVARADFKHTNIPLVDYIGNARPGELIVDIANSALFIGASSTGNVIPVGGSSNIVNMVMIPYDSLGMSFGGTTFTSNGTIGSFDYECVGNNTTVIAEFASVWETPFGVGSNDIIGLNMVFNGSVGGYTKQTMRNNTVNGQRTSTISPITGSAPGTGTGNTVTIDVNFVAYSTDDPYTFYGDQGAWLKITEVSTWVAPSGGGGGIGIGGVGIG